MCGICGIYGPRPHEDLDRSVRLMTRTIAHRGPDAMGIYVRERIALGHRRLSVLDLSATGAQPMTVEPSGTTISYNGEVYNFEDLRQLLRGAGREFRGRSDTEVILNAYDQWGLEGLKRLEGIFALALWDPPRSRLVLMRDRLGVKPLFYARTNDGLIFGSEIKALLAHGSLPSDVNEQSLVEFLWYGNAYENRTIYRDVHAVSPGHWLLLENGVAREEPWWRLEEWAKPKPEAHGLSYFATQVRTALDAAVSRQLVADVPVGIFLSGGVDSSALAASAVAGHKGELTSYSAGFDYEQGVNELPKARAVAAYLGLKHHELQVRGSDLPDVLEALSRAHDEPFADPANIPLYLLSQAIQGTVKVVLQGDGGDEMFAGYRRYAILGSQWLWNLWPRSLSSIVRAAGKPGVRIARLLEATAQTEPAMRMALLLTVETLVNSPLRLLQPDARETLQARTDPFAAYRRCAARFANHDPVQQMLLTDISLQLPSQFLAKVDRATMAHGVEARVPLLDERVAEIAVGLPSRCKIKGTQKKRVLRAALRGRLPQAILDAPKTGFGVPYEHWLRSSLHDFARDLVTQERFVTQFGLDRDAVVKAFEEHRQGGQERGFTLWKLLQLALWFRRTR